MRTTFEADVAEGRSRKGGFRSGKKSFRKGVDRKLWRSIMRAGSEETRRRFEGAKWLIIVCLTES